MSVERLAKRPDFAWRDSEQSSCLRTVNWPSIRLMTWWTWPRWISPIRRCLSRGSANVKTWATSTRLAPFSPEVAACPCQSVVQPCGAYQVRWLLPQTQVSAQVSSNQVAIAGTQRRVDALLHSNKTFCGPNTRKRTSSKRRSVSTASPNPLTMVHLSIPTVAVWKVWLDRLTRRLRTGYKNLFSTQAS